MSGEVAKRPQVVAAIDVAILSIEPSELSVAGRV